MTSTEQRYAIKFCVKLSKSATETVELLSQAYPADRLSKTQIFEWHRRFREGRETVENDPGCGRSATVTTPENIAAIEEALLDNPRLSQKIGRSSGNINR